MVGPTYTLYFTNRVTGKFDSWTNSKGSHTPTSAQPLGAHPYVLSHRDVHISISILTGSHRRTTLTSAQPLGSRSPVLIHMHIQLSRSSFPLHYTGDSSRIHHLNSLLIRD